MSLSAVGSTSGNWPGASKINTQPVSSPAQRDGRTIDLYQADTAPSRPRQYMPAIMRDDDEQPQRRESDPSLGRAQPSARKAVESAAGYATFIPRGAGNPRPDGGLGKTSR